MNSELLAKQIETYSNAIIAFVVLQGLAYSFAFGTNAYFNCLVKTATNLAEGLTLLFALTAGLSIIGTVLLGRALKRISGEFGSVVGKIYIGKLFVLIIFGLLPIVLTYGYAVGDYPGKMECKTTATRS